MVVETEVTLKDYYAFYNSFYFRNKKRVIALLLLVVLIQWVLAPLWDGKTIAIKEVIEGVLNVSFFAVIVWGIPFCASRLTAKRKFSCAGTMSIKEKITLEETGFTVATADKKVFVKYDFIRTIRAQSGYIFISLLNSETFLLPGKDFISSDVAVQFYFLIKEGIATARKKSENEYAKRKRKYFLGLLGLMPLLGSIIGILFIYWGVAKYKDQRFLLIGIFIMLLHCGMLFSFFIFPYTESGKRNQADLAQITLGYVLNEIELYKTKKGQYPDSLRRLETETGGKIIIWDVMTGDLLDPLSLHQDKAKTEDFHYYRIGDKYTLFSVGIDGIPYTKDDIYPDISKKDTSKIRLIRVSTMK